MCPLHSQVCHRPVFQRNPVGLPDSASIKLQRLARYRYEPCFGTHQHKSEHFTKISQRNKNINNRKIHEAQGGLRRGGLTPACGSAHARNSHEKYKSRGRIKANALPRGVLLI